jgi:hypothetical protein
LLNTCNKEVTDQYMSLCDFLKLESAQLYETLIQADRSNHANANNNNSSFGSSLNALEDNFELKEIIDRRLFKFLFHLKFTILS